MGPLRRLQPQDRAAEVTRAWEGETVICIASGPSLTQEQVEMTRGRRVIVVNDNYLIAPWADVLYFADAQWWKWHSEGIAKSWPWASFTAAEVKGRFAEFAGQKVSINHATVANDPNVLMLHNAGPDGLSADQKSIKTGSNSGYQAINIAVLAGAKRVLLLGYDMRYPNGRSHAHNGHPTKMGESAYRGYAQFFNTMVQPLKSLGVQVINCTSESRITAFPQVPLEQALECAAPTA